MANGKNGSKLGNLNLSAILKEPLPVIIVVVSFTLHYFNKLDTQSMIILVEFGGLLWMFMGLLKVILGSIKSRDRKLTSINDIEDSEEIMRRLHKSLINIKKTDKEENGD